MSDVATIMICHGIPGSTALHQRCVCHSPVALGRDLLFGLGFNLGSRLSAEAHKLFKMETLELFVRPQWMCFGTCGRNGLSSKFVDQSDKPHHHCDYCGLLDDPQANVMINQEYKSLII